MSSASNTSGSLQKPRLLWLITAGVLLAGGYAMILTSAFEGKRVTPQLFAGLVFWTAVIFYYWWKRRSRRGWHGALIGAMIGVVVIMVASFVGGYVSHAGKTAIENDLLSSIEKFDPSAATKIRGLQNNQPAILKTIQPLLARAIQRASDAAVLAIASAQERLVARASSENRSQCAAAARGSGFSAAGMEVS